MSVFIGIDIGTTHVKAVAFNRSGVVVHEEKSICKTLRPAADRVEQNPELVFQNTINLLKSVFVATGKESLDGVCFSAAMHSMLALGRDGQALTPAILWGDTRSIPQARKLRESGVADSLYKSSAVPVHPMLPLCKIMWLKENEPEIFASAHKFISIKEYVIYRLFGKLLVDHSIAASTGMMSLQELTWNEEALQVAGIQASRLSQLVSTTHSESGLLPEFRKFFELFSPVPFVIGSSDGCLANLGTGVWNPGKSSLTIGTSGAIRTMGTRPVFHPGQALFCYPLTERIYVSGGATNNGGYALQWYSRNFLQKELQTESDYDEFVREAHMAGPGAGGLIFLPYLQGERAPIWDAEARAVFFGLHALHDNTHMMRALLEGVGFSLYSIFEGMEAYSGHIDTICVSGGFVQSALWVQMLANIFNRKMIITNISDASAIGAALLGFYAVGRISSWEELKGMVKEGRIYYPDATEHAVYRKYFDIYKELYPALKNQFQKLAGIG